MLKEMQVLQEPQNDQVHYVPTTGGIPALYIIRENSTSVANCSTIPVVSWVVEDWDSRLWTVNAYTKKLQEIQEVPQVYVCLN